jgi:phenylalanyl-tRNA synthetase alpha chain
LVDSNGFSYYSATTAAPVKAAKAPKEAAKPKAAAPEKAPADTSAFETIILGFLAKNGEIPNTEDFCDSEKLNKEDLEPVLKSLLVDDYVILEVIEKKLIELTEEGISYAQEGSPEYQFVSKMNMGEKCDMAEMENRCGKQVAKVGFGKAMKQKWVKKEGDKFERIVENPVDEDQSKL